MLAVFLLCASVQGAGPLKFKKQKIDNTGYEAACAVDVNKDGKLDIVSGEYWFEGPKFKKKHKMCELLQQRGYYDDFGVYPMDVNADGWMDIVSGGWFGKTLSWRENPKGKAGEWKVHKIAEVGNIERPCFWDIDGDGYVEIVPNLPRGAMMFFKLERDAKGLSKGVFTRHEVSAQLQGHGLGYGDLNGDGRLDFIINKGWFEAPTKPLEGEWKLHEDFDVGHAGVPIIVHDVNEDGRNDMIVGMGHDYGLAWWEQGAKGEWTKHDVDTKNSQYHELAMADLNKDGRLELITGKRYKAHGGKDPGSDDPVGLYYFTIRKGALKACTVNRGGADKNSGAGIFMWIADLDGNGWDDLIAPGKEGLYLFWNQGPAKGAK